jgi:hypothetical protein
MGKCYYIKRGEKTNAGSALGLFLLLPNDSTCLATYLNSERR